MDQQPATLTVVVPVFNEEECIPLLFERLLCLRDRVSSVANVEFLFVDDGSRDTSLDLLSRLAVEHPFVKVIALSRNFGHQVAVTAGIDHASGDWIGLIDADLQDPPELLAEMLRDAMNGDRIDVVYGKRRSRKGETVFKKLTAAVFYRTMALLVDFEIPSDTGDFRIMSRRVVDTLRNMPERHRFLRGMIPWIGFRSAAHPYDRDERYKGESKYPLRKMARFALNAALSFSTKPLAIAMRLGLLATLVGAAGAAYMLYLKLFTAIPVPGVTSVLIAIAFFGGIQIFLIGLVGEYVARIFEEAKGRPLYVVAETRNL